MAVAAQIAPPKSMSMGAGQTSADGVVQRAMAVGVAIILTGYTRNNLGVRPYRGSFPAEYRIVCGVSSGSNRSLIEDSCAYAIY